MKQNSLLNKKKFYTLFTSCKLIQQHSYNIIVDLNLQLIIKIY